MWSDQPTIRRVTALTTNPDRHPNHPERLPHSVRQSVSQSTNTCWAPLFIWHCAGHWRYQEEKTQFLPCRNSHSGEQTWPFDNAWISTVKTKQNKTPLYKHWELLFIWRLQWAMLYRRLNKYCQCFARRGKSSYEANKCAWSEGGYFQLLTLACHHCLNIVYFSQLLAILNFKLQIISLVFIRCLSSSVHSILKGFRNVNIFQFCMKLYFQRSLINLMCHYSIIWVNEAKDVYINLQILLIVVQGQELSDNLPLARTWVYCFHLGIGCPRGLRSWALPRNDVLMIFPLPKCHSTWLACLRRVLWY